MSAETRQLQETVGDYRLVRAIGEGQMTRIWEAEQLSMQRKVVLEMLKAQAAQDSQLTASFLADVKTKALVSHPQIGAVYEAVTNEEATYFAREQLDGHSLAALYNQGTKITPLEIVKFLEQISGAMIHLENDGVATTDFQLHDFVLGDNRQIRLMNLAIVGQRDENVATRAKNLLGQIFDAMIKQGVPGATRVRSLCGFMADATRPAPLAWGQIQNLSRQVREQLEGSATVPTPLIPPNPYQPAPKAKIPAAFWGLLGGVALICGFIAVLVFSKEKQRPQAPLVTETPKPYLEIPAGKYSLAGGRSATLRKPLAISRTEVTMAQYNAFLEFPGHPKFQHPDQPASKKDHLPNHWKARWAAAVKGEEHEGQALSTDCPVVAVDWWDAFAYSKWAKGRLPTLTEWAIAAKYEGAPKSPASWGPVDASDKDLTGAGLLGAAGGVREWTRQPEVDPATPLAPKKYLAAGGSFSATGKGIKTRLWLDSRNVRRPDLGFRIVESN